ncbi:MAG TPA: hypothetical protein VF654_08895 [Pyrinomonadaceae bacterium]
MIAICPAGPPNEMNPNLTKKRNASPNDTRDAAGRVSLALTFGRDFGSRSLDS